MAQQKKKNPRPNGNARTKRGAKSGGPKPNKPRTPRGRSQAVPNGHAVHAVCSQVNPFCQAAAGAKMYDRSSAFSLPYTVRQFGTLSSDAAGLGLVEVSPDPTYGYHLGATFSAGNAVLTYGANAPPADWTTFAATSLKGFRVVSHGVRFFPVGAALTLTGSTATITSDIYGSLYSLTNDSGMECHRGPIHDAVVWISKPVDDSYVGWTAPASSNPSRTNCAFGIFGAPASTVCIGFEIIWNMEVLPTPLNPNVRLVTPPSPHIALVEDAAANLYGSTPSAHTGSLEAFGRLIERGAALALRKVADAGMQYLSTRLGPAGGAAARAGGHMLLGN